MRSIWRTTTRAVVALLVVLLCTGCIGIPENGPVVPTDEGGTFGGNPDVNYNPQPPQPGDSPAIIVENFLRAMTQTPVQTTVARAFLTADAQAAWNPEQRIITYGSRQQSGETSVSVKLQDAEWIDRRGEWRGLLPEADSNLHFEMTKEDGQWRIAKAPDALVVPDFWFRTQFLRASVYYLDPTAEILVPEPVYVPRGEQLATGLVKSLLASPGPLLKDVARSFVPAGLSLGLSVTVDAAGVADINLRGQYDQSDGQVIDLMITQLAWTLRQDPSVTGFRLSIDSVPITRADGDDQFSVDLGSEFDPTVVAASPQLYGVRGGVVVWGGPEAREPVSGPFGDTELGIGDIGVNLTGARVAAVSDAGRGLLVGPIEGRSRGVRELVSGATDLLPPCWDFQDRIWLVDQTQQGAAVSYLESRRPVALEIPGITGREVTNFVVSRDGTRLVASVKRADRQSLVVSRIKHDARGGVIGATRAIEFSSSATAGYDRIRDIGWVSPTSVGVLHLIAEDYSQVLPISVDGSPASSDDTVYSQEERGRELISSPVANEPPFLRTSDGLYDLSSPERIFTLPAGVRSISYVG